MVLIELVQELLGLVNGLLGHFVSGTTATPALTSDYEWYVGTTVPWNLTPKGSYLMGAVADIITYGAILVDWLIQAMLGGAPANVLAAPP